MQLSQFRAVLPYAAIAVYDAELEHPLNEWLIRHENQGFAWRPGSVTFGMPGDYDEVFVEAYADEPLDRDPPPVRAIVVPFEVSASRRIEISDFPGPRAEVSLESGEYALLFEAGPLPIVEKEVGPRNAGWCRLTFTRGKIDEACILVADEQLKPGYPLLMDAKPA